MSCVMSVVGICSSDNGLKISPSQNVQTPPNDKHDGHGDPYLILKFLIRFSAAAPFTSKEAAAFDMLPSRWTREIIKLLPSWEGAYFDFYTQIFF